MSLWTIGRIGLGWDGTGGSVHGLHYTDENTFVYTHVYFLAAL